VGPVPAKGRLIGGGKDHLEHAIHIPHHLIVGGPQHPKAALAEDVIPQPVLGLVVGVAIDLDDQRSLRAKEVGDEAPDDGLAAEFVAAELTIGKMPPKLLLRFGGIARISAARLWSSASCSTDRPHPLPLP
jgi:hypothetical protein